VTPTRSVPLGNADRSPAAEDELRESKEEKR
jgi:hypothetical protein